MKNKLSSAVSLVTVHIDPSSLQPDTWVVGLADIEAHTGQWMTSVNNFDAPKSTKVVFETGDILFGKLRPELRKCVIASQPGVCSTDIIVLRPNDMRDAWYLSLMLRSDRLISQVKRRTVGASLPRIRPTDLLECTLPWPNASIRHSYGKQAKTVSELRKTIRGMDNTLSVIEHRLQLPE
jgi:type I restriction enzyme, S subunit